MAAQKLRIGQVVEVEGKLYELARDPEGMLVLEPAITESAHEIVRRSGGRPLTPQEFEDWFGDLAPDDEG